MTNNIKFSFLTGDVNWSQDGGVWVSQKLNDGDKDYYLVRALINGYECLEFAFALDEDEEIKAQASGELIGKLSPDGEYKYMCTLSLIYPDEFQDKDAAIQMTGTEKTWEQMTALERVEAIHSYTSEFVEYRWYGNSHRGLFKVCQDAANGLA